MIIKHSINIEKSAKEIFPWLAEPSKAMQWQKNVKNGKIIKKEQEIIGTTFKEEIEENGKKLELKGIITNYKNDKEIGFHLESRIHNVMAIYFIEEGNGKSMVSTDIKIKWKFPMNILSIVSGKKIKKEITRQLESEFLELKRLCEI